MKRRSGKTFNSEDVEPMLKFEDLPPNARRTPICTLRDGCEDADAGATLPQEYLQQIERLVNENFTNVPVESADDNLGIQLQKLQETVLEELLVLGSASQLRMNRQLEMIGHCHLCIFYHLDLLLGKSMSTKQAFEVLHWVLHTYLSTEFLGHPQIWKSALKALDLILLTDWVPRAQRTLMDNVQRHLSDTLDKIIRREETDREGGVSGNEENFNRLHLDTIQCVHAVLKGAEGISPTLKDKVLPVCIKELQRFVQRYKVNEKNNLQKEAKMAHPEALHFIKTLNECRELKLYLRSHLTDRVRSNNLENTIENMEDFALKMLLETPNAELYLQRYFKSEDTQLVCLLNKIDDVFCRLPNGLEVHKIVVNKLYQCISDLYLKHLLLRKRTRLEKRWPNGVGNQVTRDAELLHEKFSDLNPAVNQWNIVLMKVREILESSSPDSLKLTLVKTKTECVDASCSVQTEQLVDLLRWKGGLSNAETTEVILACFPDYQIRPTQWRCIPCLC